MDIFSLAFLHPNIILTAVCVSSSSDLFVLFSCIYCEFLKLKLQLLFSLQFVTHINIIAPASFKLIAFELNYSEVSFFLSLDWSLSFERDAIIARSRIISGV